MNPYENYTKIELIERLQELETLLQQYRLEREEEESLKFAWTGNLGHWYWDVVTNKVTHNPLKVTTLGYEIAEIPGEIGFEFFTEKLHKDDYEAVMDVMRGHLKGDLPAYDVEYRIQTKDGNWRWYHDIGKVTKRADNGKPLFVAGIVFDITERKLMQSQIEEQNKQLSILATIDGLTEVFNRQAVFNKLQEEINRAQRYSKKLSVLLLDIDHFKNVNDSYGHQQGDLVLKTIAGTIKHSIRVVDIVGRYGGEEFLVIFPEVDAKEAFYVAERLREDISQLKFKEDFSVTISGGLTAYKGTSLFDLIEKADQLLYKAKASGRNQIQIEE